VRKNTYPVSNETFLYDECSPTINPFGSKWGETCAKIRRNSRFRHFDTYSIKSFIFKANDDLRQELMTMQLIKRIDYIFKKAEIPLKLRPYEILITSPSSGLIEFLPNTSSIDSIKKNLPSKWDLNTFFRKFFFNNFEEAQKNFTESLAAYSLVNYIINIKDRHNGNILLDMNGHIIHIDFGFILGISPGNLGFENAPFKLTKVNNFNSGIYGDNGWN
jgi:phosphatidylinositol 4-kinase